MKMLLLFLSMLSFLFIIPNSSLAVTVLDFEGLDNRELILGYYDGGLGDLGSGPGPDFDITFSDNSYALIDADAGGTGNFGGEPSPDTIAFFPTSSGLTMNVLNGFDTGFSFFYSAVVIPGVVRVLDATDSVLATLNLPLTPFRKAPDPTGDFSPLIPVGVSFSGTAFSVDFNGTLGQIGFDNITLGSEIPGGAVIPEPTAMLLFGSGLIGLAGFRSKLRRS